MKVTLSKSSHKPKATLVDIVKNQADVCVSWCKSNSLIKTCSAFDALIVVIPLKVELRCEKTLDFAKTTVTYLFFQQENAYSCLPDV